MGMPARNRAVSSGGEPAISIGWDGGPGCCCWSLDLRLPSAVEPATKHKPAAVINRTDLFIGAGVGGQRKSKSRDRPGEWQGHITTRVDVNATGKPSSRG